MRYARYAMLVCCVVPCVTVAACGGGDASDNSSSSTSPSTKAATDDGGGVTGKPFKTFRIVTNGIDSFDPHLSSTVQGGGGVGGQAYLTLLAYRHANGPAGQELIPAIAESVPKPSADGLTYVFKLRKVSFYDGQPVRPSDVKASIERIYKVRSPLVSRYGAIEGANKFGKTLKGDISGIVADDTAGTVTFKLTEPSGLFLNTMADGVVFPADTPAKDASTNMPPATGPLRIVSYEPDRGYVLVKNEKYVPIDGIPAATVDRIEGTVVSDAQVALQRTIDGEADYDQVEVPTDKIAELQTKYPDQLKLNTLPGTHMFFFNVSKAPFNKLEARQAVNYAIDREAIVKLAGGLASPTQNILPPTYSAYKKLDVYTYDLDKAKQLIKDAGLVGAPVRVIGASIDGSRPFVTYLADQLKKIGLKPELKIVSADVYFGLGGTASTGADTGWFPWNEGIPHPNDWFAPLFDGTALKPAGNTNWDRMNIPEINDKIHELAQKPLSEVVDQYAELDRELVEDQAAMAPYMNPSYADFFGPDVDTRCYIVNPNTRFDVSQVCAK